MLINRGYTSGDVVCFKISNGDEIVAKLVEDGPAYYKLSRPMVIGMGQQGPGLMPYLFTVHPDKEVKLNKGVVAMAEATDKQFADQFIQSTTGIKLV